MLTMGSAQSVIKINFEDVKEIMSHTDVTIINTLSFDLQSCLIRGSLTASEETRRLEALLNKNRSARVVVYGKNACDDTIVKKYNQLVSLGFNNVAVYPGGMLEWLLLQEVYGSDEIPTTTKEIDILKYKGDRASSRLLLTY